ncbi:hypothetical protein EGW08_006387 [Elysia chlorotica]|uniref:Uncharacterized protein n=1 Tax=Elysia chlorotica TaxID=188477 RepID=A0A3S1BPQ4_ELYCH|nr:hypothetical protein EGW08_006387 [Elysia chlorotica]
MDSQKRVLFQPAQKMESLNGINFLFVLSVLWTSVLMVVTFNVDTENAYIYKGPENSFFGYSVAILENSQGTWLLVGAPKANDSSLPRINEPGAIFRCNWRYPSSCYTIFVDYVGNEKQVFRTWRNITVDHKKDHQLLGASIDVNVEGNSNVMICAPRWVENQYHLQGMSFMNGLCYESNKELEFDDSSGWPVFDNLKKQIHSSGTYYVYGMGMLGSSAAYSQDGEFAVLGSPGVNDFAGGFVHIKGSDKKKPQVVDIPVEASNSYFGSSITTARLTKDEISTVVGGPRAGSAGKIFVYDSKLELLLFKEGEQLGSSFGASVCSLDLNGDGLDDIVVGAPLYSKEMDEGRVYVYINREFFNLELLKPILSGTNSVGARFGTAVANLGDLNVDGYQDLAVGAPYEGGGVVYIYNGASFGMHYEPSQRIVGRDLHKSLKAFGWSFSRPWDVDRDHYQDFAVGSYESSTVVLLRTRSVLDLNANLTISPQVIDLASEPKCRLRGLNCHCIEAEMCFKYSGQNLHPSSEINMTLTLDTIERHRGERSRLFIPGQGNTELESLQELVVLRLNRGFCIKRKIYTRMSRDVVTPLQMQLDFDIASSSIGIASECEICPIRNKYNPTVKIERAQFALDCGKDHNCQPKLEVHAKPLYSKGKSTFLVDDTPYFDLELTVSNNGETSYLTVVTLAYPSALHFSYVYTVGKGPAVTCVPAESLLNSTLAVLDCDIMSPIQSMKRNTFKARFYGYGLSYSTHEFDILFGASSARTELNRDKMELSSVTIPVQMSTQMKFSGVSIPGQLSFPHKAFMSEDHNSSNWASLSHLYVLRNMGPSPMPHGQLTLAVPLSEWIKVDNVLIETKTISRPDSHVPVDCSLTDKYDRGKINRSAASREKKDGSSVLYKECESDAMNCSTVVCYVGLMHIYETVYINISIGIRKDVLQTLKVSNMLGLISYGNLLEPSYKSYKSETVSHAIMTTTFISYKPLPKKAVTWWALAISICSGLLLLYVITVILWKFGFFRRKKKEELQNLIKSTESERELLSSDSISAGSSDVMVLPAQQLSLDQTSHHVNHNVISHLQYPERDRLFYYPHLEPESPQDNGLDRDPLFSSRSLNRRDLQQHYPPSYFHTLQYNRTSSFKRVPRTRPISYHRNQSGRPGSSSTNNNSKHRMDAHEPDIWVAPPPAPPQPPSFDNSTYLEPFEPLESRA